MNVVIVGAGPAGLFLAHQLLALSPSYRVQLYESNPNPTDLEPLNNRGFGLGLGARVRQWLNGIAGLEEQLASQGVEFNPGGLILIPHRQLCALLVRTLRLDRSEQTPDGNPRLSVNFNASVVDVDLVRHEIEVEREFGSETVTYDLLVGADGIHSLVRRAMMVSLPEEIQFQQQQRPQVWKALQLPVQPELQHPLRILRLQTRSRRFGFVFGGCLPQKQGGFIALIFWQPTGNQDRLNPGGIATIEELEQLLQQMTPKSIPVLQLDPEQAAAFLAARPGHEYWSQCRCYHHLEGRAVLIGDAAHGMFSLLGQGCTAAIADAVALSTLLGQYDNQLSSVLPQFSAQQVKEGHAASDLNLITLVFYHRWLGLLYKVFTLLWIFVLKQPSIFAQLNQVDASYARVLRNNQLWVWLAKQLFKDNKSSIV
ncbi:FAD-dependent oxidoreductase [Aerosakkonema funiforme]|uniref:FAD-dependent oxidoreductase n=1 Tax=Aerosakkonema funiforme TaxID=1246630 RepID=UPI0035B9E285